MQPSTLESIAESIEIWEAWQSETDPELNALALETLAELREKKALLEMLLGEYQTFGPGFTLKHKDRPRWRFILRDASQPGRFRWQEFACNGFIGHYTYSTPEECLGDMVDDDYLIPDHDALERIHTSVEWLRGMEITNVIQAANARLITWEEGNRRLEAINTSYGLANA